MSYEVLCTDTTFNSAIVRIGTMHKKGYVLVEDVVEDRKQALAMGLLTYMEINSQRKVRLLVEGTNFLLLKLSGKKKPSLLFTASNHVYICTLTNAETENLLYQIENDLN